MRSGRDLQGEQVNGELRIEGEGWAGGRALGASWPTHAASECGCRGRCCWPWELLFNILLLLCSEHFETPGSV